jgi:hypothetical protein
MSSLCVKYGCDFQVDLDGQVTCSLCGSKDDDMPNPVDLPDSPPPLKYGIGEKY